MVGHSCRAFARSHLLLAAALALAIAVALPAVAAARVAPRAPLASAGRQDPPAALHGLGGAAARTAAHADYHGAVLVPASPSNYTLDDRPWSDPIRRIVIHVAEGSLAATTAWFANPAAQASAHYVVGSDGRIAQSVPERDIAWHAGNWAYNVTSVGIEHAGYTNRTHFPDVQYRASARLAGYLARKYLIPPDRSHVIGHSEVPDPFHKGEWGGADHHTDPGRTWNWRLYMSYLRLDAADTAQVGADDSRRGQVRASSAWQRVRARAAYGGTALATRGERAGNPARFRLVLPRTARYDVFLRWPCASGASGAVRVAVGAAGGARGAHVSERSSCGRWVRLGAYRLRGGARWAVSISSRSGDGRTVYADAVRAVAAADRVAPSPPETVRALPGETSAVVRVAGARDDVGIGGYAVALGPRRVGFARGRHIDVADLACASAYTFSVRSLDLAGNRSQAVSVSARTGACPLPPSGLVASSPSPRRVRLSWQASPSRVSGYQVWLGGRRAALVSGTTALLRGLRCGTTYRVSVRSIDSRGGRSTAVSAAVTTRACPGVPRSLRLVRRGRRSLEVAWSRGAGTVAGYRVFLAGSELGRTGGLTYALRGLHCGRRYGVAVAAIDGVGDMSPRALRRLETAPCRGKRG